MGQPVWEEVSRLRETSSDTGILGGALLCFWLIHVSLFTEWLNFKARHACH